jgi:hypothetical protein
MMNRTDVEMVRAVVQVGATETVYIRAGRGMPLSVVLASSEPERYRLIARFARNGRVVAPVLPAAAMTVEEWLRGVIDGLGLERPAVVLAPELAVLAQQLARTAPDLDVVIAAADDELETSPLPAPQGAH